MFSLAQEVIVAATGGDRAVMHAHFDDNIELLPLALVHCQQLYLVALRQLNITLSSGEGSRAPHWD